MSKRRRNRRQPVFGKDDMAVTSEKVGGDGELRRPLIVRIDEVIEFEKFVDNYNELYKEMFGGYDIELIDDGLSCIDSKWHLRPIYVCYLHGIILNDEFSYKENLRRPARMFDHPLKKCVCIERELVEVVSLESLDNFYVQDNP